MQKLLAFFVGASVLALAAPSAFERYRAARLADEEAIAAAPAIVEAAAPTSGPPPASGRSERLTAEPDGHFRASVRINGRFEDILVDTGATYVAMNEETARRLGLRILPEDYRHRAATANGETPVALARLGRVEIGRVSVRDVDVMVMKGDALGVTLLGMSFLGKLKRFAVEGDRLDLVE